MGGTPRDFVKLLHERQAHLVVLFDHRFCLLEGDVLIAHHAPDPHAKGGLQPHMQHICKAAKHLEAAAPKQDYIPMMGNGLNDMVEHFDHHIPLFHTLGVEPLPKGGQAFILLVELHHPILLKDLCDEMFIYKVVTQ